MKPFNRVPRITLGSFENVIQRKCLQIISNMHVQAGFNRYIGLIGRVFINGPGDRGSISGPVIPKTKNMELDASLLNTYHYKVWIKGKLEQSGERSNALRYTSV